MSREALALFNAVIKEEERNAAFSRLCDIRTSGICNYQEALDRLRRRLYTKEG